MALLVVCVLAGVAFAAVSIAMLLVGLVSLCPPKLGARHRGCGHPRVVTGPHPEIDRCWWCRHERLAHAMLIPDQLAHLGH